MCPVSKEARKDEPGDTEVPAKPAAQSVRADAGPAGPPLALTLCQICGLTYSVGSRCPRGH